MRGMHPSARFGSGRGVAPVAPLPPPRRTPIRNEPTPETPPPENTVFALPSNLISAQKFVSPNCAKVR